LIKKVAVSAAFFICKQFANTIFGGGEKELVNIKVKSFPQNKHVEE